MNIGLFKKPYVIRTYEKQDIEEGYDLPSIYADSTARLNVQPLSSDELMALPEGERTVKRVKSFGADKLISADEYSGTPGNSLYYNGHWYECKSSVMWDHTMLSHYRSEFVILPPDKQKIMGAPKS